MLPEATPDQGQDMLFRCPMHGFQKAANHSLWFSMIAVGQAVLHLIHSPQPSPPVSSVLIYKNQYINCATFYVILS